MNEVLAGEFGGFAVDCSGPLCLKVEHFAGMATALFFIFCAAVALH